MCAVDVFQPECLGDKRGRNRVLCSIFSSQTEQKTQFPHLDPSRRGRVACSTPSPSRLVTFTNPQCPTYVCEAGFTLSRLSRTAPHKPRPQGDLYPSCLVLVLIPEQRHLGAQPGFIFLSELSPPHPQRFCVSVLLRAGPEPSQKRLRPM